MFGESWASEEKLDRLRRSGIVPYSSPAAFLITILVVGLVTFSWRAELEKVLLLMSFKAEINNYSDLTSLVRPLLEFLLWLNIITCFVLLIVGLLQTRFLFRPQQISFNMTWRWRLKPLIILKSFAKSMLVFLFALVLAYLFFETFIASFLGLLNRDQSELWLYIHALAKSYIAAVVSALFLLLLTMIGGSRLWYAIKHRMTRAEIETENRGR